LLPDEGSVDEPLAGDDEPHDRRAAVEDAPMGAQTFDDLEHEVERVLADPRPLGDVGAEADAGKDRLDRVACPEVEPVLGREVIEPREAVPVAVERLGRLVLAAGMEPPGELVATRLADRPGRGLPDRPEPAARLGPGAWGVDQGR